MVKEKKHSSGNAETLQKFLLDKGLHFPILEEVTKPAMDEKLAQKAVSQALTGDWEKAIQTNSEILKADSGNVDALNRLARAYAESGDLKNAKKTASEVVKIDPYNSIANKSLKKWKGLRSGSKVDSGTSQAGIFLEEPGKTQIVSLLDVAGRKVVSSLDSGDEVLLNPHKHRVSITTRQGKYVGRLPDDISARLRKLTSAGNEYQVFVKSTEDTSVKVFVRETKKSPKLADIPSFPSEKIEYIAFTPPELVHKKDDRPILEEEGESD